MKKVIALILAVLMMGVLFVGCSGEKKEEPKAEETAAEETATVAIASPEDLKGKTIAVQEGTTGDLIASEIEGAEVVRFKKATDAAMELKNGRADCVIIDNMPASKIVERNDDMMILDFAPTEDIETYAIAVNKGDEELLGAVDATIEELMQNGTYELIYDYYISGEDVELPAIPEYEADGVIIMGTNAEFEPFEYIDDNGDIVGFDIEISKWIAYKLGKELVIENMAFDSLIAALPSGKINFIAAGMTNTEERRQNVDFSQDYYIATQAIIVMK